MTLQSILNKYGLKTRQGIDQERIEKEIKKLYRNGAHWSLERKSTRFPSEIFDIFRMETSSMYVGDKEVFSEKFGIDKMGQQTLDCYFSMLVMDAAKNFEGPKFKFRQIYRKTANEILKMELACGKREIEDFFKEAQVKSLFRPEKKGEEYEKYFYDKFDKWLGELSKSRMIEEFEKEIISELESMCPKRKGLVLNWEQNKEKNI